MGHSIQHYTFDENESKEKIYRITNSDAIEQGDYGDGLNSDIRYIDKLYEDKDEAVKAIEELDNGWYDQLAVKFYHYETRKETKGIENLRARILKHKEDLDKYKEERSIKNRKTKFVGCDSCGSKINKDYISSFTRSHMWNSCPLCQNNLSSETVKKYIENKVEVINKSTEALDEAIKNNNKKGKKKVMWLVKTEFHV